MEEAEGSGQPLTALGHWRATDRWRPGRTGTASSGRAVECLETGELGFCKTVHVVREKICSDLAREVQVKVPEAKLGNLEGHNGIVVVSLAFGRESLDLPMLASRDPALYASPAVQQAIRVASGLLPFYTWAEITDFKDDHLVIAEEGGGYVVAAIDFASSLQWNDPTQAVTVLGAHPALTVQPDIQVIEETVRRIEELKDDRIAQTVNSIPDDLLPANEKDRVIKGLQFRRSQVRDAMRQRGWMP